MRFVEVGQQIKVYRDKSTDMSFQSFVIKVEADRLYIDISSLDVGVKNQFQEADEIFCSLTTAFGVRLFNSIVIDAQKDYIVIDFSPEDYQVFQRRQYIRMDVAMPAMLEVDGRFIRIETFDLGGGGVRFKSDTFIETNINANLRISLFSDEPNINIFGKIMKMEYYKENEYLFFFTLINENIRSKFIKKCIEIQSSNVRKILERYESNH